MSETKTERCGKRVGSKPWWMGVDQHDPCECLLEPGHRASCKCEHDLAKGSSR